MTPGATDHVLSPQQLNVARLIAKGKSNKEIGAALGISARTVQVHLRFAFAKTGVRNRSGLAAWAIRKGIAEL